MSGLSRWRQDEGSAMLIAILTMSVCLSLALVGVGIAQSTGRSRASTGSDCSRSTRPRRAWTRPTWRSRTAARHRPARISSANVRSGPDIAQYATTITYLRRDGGDAGLPAEHRVRRRPSSRASRETNTLGGGGTKGKRTMEALVNIVPVNGVNLVNAIFANGSLTFDNKTTITGNNGPDADVYSNANYGCSNNEDFAGSIYSQGSITLSNSCKVAGNIWAKTGIANSSAWNGSVAGFAKVGCRQHRPQSGARDRHRKPDRLGHHHLRRVHVGEVLHRRFAGLAALPAVPDHPRGCGDAGEVAGRRQWGQPLQRRSRTTTAPTSSVKIRSTYSQAGTNTLVSTNCLVALGNTDFSLKNDLAIFTKGGLTTGRSTLSSTPAATTRNVHFIVPYDAVAAHPVLVSIPMDTDKQFDFTSRDRPVRLQPLRHQLSQPEQPHRSDLRRQLGDDPQPVQHAVQAGPGPRRRRELARRR